MIIGHVWAQFEVFYWRKNFTTIVMTILTSLSVVTTNRQKILIGSYPVGARLKFCVLSNVSVNINNKRQSCSLIKRDNKYSARPTVSAHRDRFPAQLRSPQKPAI